MYYVYVLQSRSNGNLYKGFCSDLAKRLSEHNSGKTKSTKSSIPWKVVYYESYNTIEEAIHREKYLKSSAGRRFLKMKLQIQVPRPYDR